MWADQRRRQGMEATPTSLPLTNVA
jgi:hypothetical protein